MYLGPGTPVSAVLTLMNVPTAHPVTVPTARDEQGKLVVLASALDRPARLPLGGEASNGPGGRRARTGGGATGRGAVRRPRQLARRTAEEAGASSRGGATTARRRRRRPARPGAATRHGGATGRWPRRRRCGRRGGLSGVSPRGREPDRASGPGREAPRRRATGGPPRRCRARGGPPPPVAPRRGGRGARLGCRGNGEQHVVGAGLDQHRPRRHEGAEVLVLEAAEHSEHDLGATHVPRHLVALGPRREVAAHTTDGDPVVDRGRPERDRPAVGDADHAEPRRIDERCPSSRSRQRRRSQTFWANGFQPAIAAWTKLVSQA